MSKATKPIGDPSKMEYGSAERNEWFEQARAYRPEFTPSRANPSKLVHGSVEWYLWCEWEDYEEAMAEYWGALYTDAMADYACHEPDDRADCIPMSRARQHKRTKRTRRQVRKAA